MKIGFILRTAPYSNQNSDTVFELAKRAIEKGHNIEIFLYEDGTLNMRNDVKPTGERDIPARFAELIALGAKIVGCGVCAKFRGIARENIIDGAKISGMATLAGMVESCDKLLTFGY